ncbi:hypothetical protein BDV96DRAFT_632070 [Lophiotrema nucula]|uniref:Uncharacterized protein n=1 Tax=Lophiotrema nucula TaxID=690887 RepID=A0A6A5Z7S4_9PLEO|nr:hypothetical protein BDV96DRAFT_632070 [Lophiotrema nucula]
MEQIMSQSKKASSRPRKLSNKLSNNNRYSARYLILEYNRTSDRFDPLEIQRLVSREQAQCTIVRQSLNDDTSHYLAFVDFAGKRFQTRNLSLFDIQGHHPRWVHVSSSPWHQLEDMKQRGDVVWNGISIARTRNAPPSASEAPQTSKKTSFHTLPEWELVGSSSNEKAFLDLCRSHMPRKSFDIAEKQLRMDPPVQTRGSGPTEISRNVEYWQDGYRAGFKECFAQLKKQQKANSSLSEDVASVDFAPISQLNFDFEAPDLSQLDDQVSTSTRGTQEPFPTSFGWMPENIPQVTWEWEDAELYDGSIDIS